MPFENEIAPYSSWFVIIRISYMKWFPPFILQTVLMIKASAIHTPPPPLVVFIQVTRQGLKG